MKKNTPSGIAVAAEWDEGVGWTLHLKRSFVNDDGRTSSYRMRYRGLSGAELVSVLDIELDDLTA